MLVKDLVGHCGFSHLSDSGPGHSRGARKTESPVLEFRHICQHAGVYILCGVYLPYLHGVRNHNLFVFPLGFHHLCNRCFGEGDPRFFVDFSTVCEEALLHCCYSIPRVDTKGGNDQPRHYLRMGISVMQSQSLKADNRHSAVQAVESGLSPEV